MRSGPVVCHQRHALHLLAPGGPTGALPTGASFHCGRGLRHCAPPRPAGAAGWRWSGAWATVCRARRAIWLTGAASGVQARVSLAKQAAQVARACVGWAVRTGSVRWGTGTVHRQVVVPGQFERQHALLARLQPRLQRLRQGVGPVVHRPCGQRGQLGRQRWFRAAPARCAWGRHQGTRVRRVGAALSGAVGQIVRRAGVGAACLLQPQQCRGLERCSALGKTAGGGCTRGVYGDASPATGAGSGATPVYRRRTCSWASSAARPPHRRPVVEPPAAALIHPRHPGVKRSAHQPQRLVPFAMRGVVAPGTARRCGHVAGWARHRYPRAGAGRQGSTGSRARPGDPVHVPPPSPHRRALANHPAQRHLPHPERNSAKAGNAAGAAETGDDRTGVTGAIAS